MSGDLFLCQKGRRKRHAVTECCQPHSSLTGESRLSTDSRLWRSWTRGSKCSHSPPFSHHRYPPLPIILLLLSIHLFVRIPFPSCLLIVVVPHNLFLHWACSSSPRARSFQQRLEALAGRPPGCSKNSHTPFFTCGPVQPDRGFHRADDGAQSSFLSPHKSVCGLRPIV